MGRTVHSTVVVLTCITLMSACSRKLDAPPAAQNALPGAAAVLSQSGAPGLYDQPVSCPSSIAVVPRPAGAPADDIRGLRIGTSLDDAVLYVKCLDKGAVFASRSSDNEVRANYFGRQVRTFVDIGTGVVDPNLKNARLDPVGIFRRPNDRYGLTAFGEPGHEILYQIHRQQEFDDGHAPTIAAVIADLKSKYGDPQSDQTDSRGARLVWMRDAEGRIATDTRLKAGCQAVRAGDWSSECGLTVWVSIDTQRGNELLVERLEMGVVEQAKLVDAITRSEAAWKAADEQRKQGEAQNAARNKPNL